MALPSGVAGQAQEVRRRGRIDAEGNGGSTTSRSARGGGNGGDGGSSETLTTAPGVTGCQ